MNFIEFKYPFNIIYIILPLASCILLILGYKKKERILNLLRIKTVKRFRILRTVLAVLGLALILFSLLGPQSFIGLAKINKEGLDIYVLIDTSKSMLAEDIKPDRLSRAKNIIESIIDNLEGDRIGFIPFSSAAYIQMPLTDDYDLARMYLDVIDTDMIAGGGTNVGTALNLAENSFEETSSADRVVIILSDGEEHNSNSVDILKSFNDEHLKVFTIGIGTAKGGLVPDYGSDGGQKSGYKKDSNGEFVMSKLNSETLKKLASTGKGSYYQSSLTGDEIASLTKKISSLKKDTYKADEVRRFKQLYQFFLGPGILLFLIAYLLPERRNTL
ncbi:VWA domain-containing protein [Acetivibrio cellulolyticus]|uniref:VWA domain-containing protein n=1 Tax=Acetivibrio cellulolyticus TaxID=35830 RepID=UPI0001E2F5B7|nr:VWA domain-containing protein [Acetivibrio cellulolyticus]